AVPDLHKRRSAASVPARISCTDEKVSTDRPPRVIPAPHEGLDHDEETVMAHSQHPTPPPLTGDDITHYRRIIAGGPGNTRQKITVGCVSLSDNGEASPPILSVHGELDMSPDQAIELVDALTAARAAYAVALKAWYTGLTPQNTP